VHVPSGESEPATAASATESAAERS
jgi:hypothetical protein